MAKLLDVMLSQIPSLWSRIQACEEELERHDDDKKTKTKKHNGIPMAMTAMISLLSVMMAFLTMSRQAMITSIPGEPPKGGDGGVYTLLIAPPDKPDRPVAVPALPPPGGSATSPRIVMPRGVRRRIDKRPKLKLPRNHAPAVEEVEEDVAVEEVEDVMEFIPTNPEWWHSYLEKALATLSVGVLTAGVIKEGSK